MNDEFRGKILIRKPRNKGKYLIVLYYNKIFLFISVIFHIFAFHNKTIETISVLQY